MINLLDTQTIKKWDVHIPMTNCKINVTPTAESKAIYFRSLRSDSHDAVIICFPKTSKIFIFHPNGQLRFYSAFHIPGCYRQGDEAFDRQRTGFPKNRTSEVHGFLLVNIWKRENCRSGRASQWPNLHRWCLIPIRGLNNVFVYYWIFFRCTRTVFITF